MRKYGLSSGARPRRAFAVATATGAALITVVACGPDRVGRPARSVSPEDVPLAEACGASFDRTQQLLRTKRPQLLGPFAAEYRPTALRSCVLERRAPGAPVVTDAMLACIKDGSCELAPGTRRTGEPCALSTQCASLDCDAEGGSSDVPMRCGRCRARIAAGADCANGIGSHASCEHGYECFLGRCAKPLPPRGAGEPCMAERVDGASVWMEGIRCQPGLVCKRAEKKGEASTCVPVPRAGEPCVGGECGDDLVCGGTVCQTPPKVGERCLAGGGCADLALECNVESGRCMMRGVAGAPCEDSYCGVGLTCGRLEPHKPRTCDFSLHEGAVCEIGRHPACGAYLVCLNGRCMVDDPARCGM